MVETVTEATREELGRLHLLRSVDLNTIEPLLRSCAVRHLHDGEVLIASGQPNHNLYALLSGRLGIRLGSIASEPILQLSAGESVGELSLIDRRPASAFVVAEAASRVLVVDEQLLWMLVSTSHAVSSNLLHMLSGRLRSGNDMMYHDRELLEEFRFQATIDAITGLYNRHWLEQMLPRQMERSRVQDEPLALAMADIDHFKQYNDSHGHLAGDCALSAVARSMRENLRPADMAARFGGEEFIMLLPDSDVQGAKLAAERLRKAVARTAVTMPDGTEIAQVTISLGVAELSAEYNPDAFINAADEALYRAKEAGRNGVCD